MFERRMTKAVTLFLMVAALTMVAACTHREPTNVSGFGVGDVVQLESGGPQMTIERFVGKRDRQVAYCVWFAGGKRKHGRFPLGSLTADDSQFTPVRDPVQPATASCTAEQAETAQFAAKNGYKTGTTCR
jgi:uncharacterized protein YodC (DUF2158 family)